MFLAINRQPFQQASFASASSLAVHRPSPPAHHFHTTAILQCPTRAATRPVQTRLSLLVQPRTVSSGAHEHAESVISRQPLCTTASTLDLDAALKLCLSLLSRGGSKKARIDTIRSSPVLSEYLTTPRKVLELLDAASRSRAPR